MPDDFFQHIDLSQYQHRADPPVFSPEQGSLASTQIVTLTAATAGAQIRYTIDGNQPTETSPLYTGPFEINQPVTIKAKAFKTGLLPSRTASASYSFDNQPPSMPHNLVVTSKTWNSITITWSA